MWILLTISAVILWSFVNIADNYLVERNKKSGDPIGSLVIFSSLFGFIAALIILFFTKSIFVLSVSQIAVLLLAGLCNVSWIIFYLKALPDEDVSTVIPWFLTSPFFGYILGYIILGENLSTKQLLGGLIILIGGLLLSIKRQHDKSGYTIRWLLIRNMTIASLLAALWAILFKFIARENDFWISSFWEHIGLGVGGLFIIFFAPSYRKGFLKIIRSNTKQILFINLSSETLTITGNLLANYAILLVPVTAVLLLEVIQPAIVFILGIFFTIFFPKILREDISRNNLIQKGTAIAIMILGAMLLT
jgi:transporter family protein